MGHLEGLGIDRIQIDTKIHVDSFRIFPGEVKTLLGEFVGDFGGDVLHVVFYTNNYIIHVANDHTIFTDVKRWIKRGNCECQSIGVGEGVGEFGPPNSTGTTIAIAGFGAFDAFVFHARILIIWWWYLQVEGFIECALEEGAIEVDLDGVKVVLDAQVMEKTDGGEIDNWTVSVVLGDVFGLEVAAND